MFEKRYGFHNAFDGYYYRYHSREEFWAFTATCIKLIYESAAGQPYLDLEDIVEDKPAFKLTTNADGQFFRVFSKENICAFQGDFGFCQCSQPCHDEIIPNRKMVQEMTSHLEGVRLPSELVPRCPDCGRVLVPWVRDHGFLEGKMWKKSVKRYHQFLRHWLLEKSGKKLVLLELGVGEMTPAVIKLPFWELTAKNQGIFYACINKKESSLPVHLKDREIYIRGDLSETLGLLKETIRKKK